MFDRLPPILFVLLLAASQPALRDSEQVVYSSELTATSQSVRRLTPQALLPSMGAVGGLAAFIADHSQKFKLGEGRCPSNLGSSQSE